MNRAHRPVGDGSVVLDELLKRYTYDGHGRLVQTESPRPEPENANAAASDVPLRVERFYYDGIRRLQEVVHDLAAPVAAGQPRAVDDTFLSREYIWGPGDGPAGVDEPLAQFDGSDTEGQGKPWWTLQDAGGDVVALCETPAPISGVPQLARVVGQWSFDPYGTVIAAEQLYPHPPPHVGHKGLVLDALDEPIVASGGGQAPRLLAFSESLYHVRNRTYSPRIGRWLQRDPNASGLGVIANAAHGGGSIDSAPMDLSLETLFANGANLHVYVGGDPNSRVDRLGLFWFDDDEGEEELPEDGYGFYDFYQDATSLLNQVPGPGDYISGVYRGVLEEYSANLMWDVGWATNWNASDDWHTRSSDLWILQAMGKGLHEAFDINLPFDFGTFNPLGDYQAGVAIPKGENGGYRNVMTKPLQEHHIATNKGSKAADMEAIFRRGGMTLDHPANRIMIPHSGRHNPAYHDFIETRLDKVSKGKSEAAARKAIVCELDRLGKFIVDNPHFPYDTSKSKRTGWKNMRTHVKLKMGQYVYSGPRRRR